MSKKQTYKCPHCGKELQEVSVVDLNAKQLVVSAGMGIGVGLFAYSLVEPVGAIGGFIVAFMIVFLFLRRRR